MHNMPLHMYFCGSILPSGISAILQQLFIHTGSWQNGPKLALVN